MRMKLDESADVTNSLQKMHIKKLLTFVTAMPPISQDRLRAARPHQQSQKNRIGIGSPDKMVLRIGQIREDTHLLQRHQGGERLSPRPDLFIRGLWQFCVRGALGCIYP